jgi:hypothetical protein
MMGEDFFRRLEAMEALAEVHRSLGDDVKADALSRRVSALRGQGD